MSSTAPWGEHRPLAHDDSRCAAFSQPTTLCWCRARYFAQHFGAAEPSFFERQILNLGGIAQEWGKRGLNVVRFQGQVYPNAAIGFPADLTKLYLDLAASAGVFVIFDCSIDTIAKAGFNGTGDGAWKDLIANLTLVRDHPALMGCKLTVATRLQFGACVRAFVMTDFRHDRLRLR